MVGSAPNYLERVKVALNAAEQRFDQAEMVIGDSVPQEETAGVGYWLKAVLTTASSGLLPDLGLFPGLGLTPATPAEDFRWRIYDQRAQQFPRAGEGWVLIGSYSGRAVHL